MEAVAALPAWRANLATIGALMARARNELVRVPGAAIPGVLAPTIFFLGLNGVFGALTQLQGFGTGAYESFVVPVSMLQGRGSPGLRRESTWPATSSRAGSTGCSSPPLRAGCCWRGRCSPQALAR